MVFSLKGILCELTNEDGTMVRLSEICQFVLKHEMIVLSIECIVKYRALNLIKPLEIVAFLIG